MARKKLNKSAAIRDTIAKNPKASTSGIVQLLAERRIIVSPTLVSNVKARMSRPAGRRGRRAKANGQIGVTQLVAASEFARQVGGVEQATQALATLERLR
jgi:hypothetical protein